MARHHEGAPEHALEKPRDQAPRRDQVPPCAESGAERGRWSSFPAFAHDLRSRQHRGGPMRSAALETGFRKPRVYPAHAARGVLTPRVEQSLTANADRRLAAVAGRGRRAPDGGRDAAADSAPARCAAKIIAAAIAVDRLPDDVGTSDAVDEGQSRCTTAQTAREVRGAVDRVITHGPAYPRSPKIRPPRRAPRRRGTPRRSVRRASPRPPCRRR